MNVKVATGLRAGRHASPSLALAALEEALEKLGETQANSILLLLTPEFLPMLDTTLRICARRASCTRILGANCRGVLTEAGAILNQAACAVMVLAAPYHLDPPQTGSDGETQLSFATADACDWGWLQQGHPRIGMLTSPGLRGGRVWSGIRSAVSGRIQALISGISDSGTVLSRGLRQLTPLLHVSRNEGSRILALDGRPALEWLARCLPYSARESEKIPLHHLMLACPLDEAGTLQNGRFRLLHITRTDPADQLLELSEPVESGQGIYFVLRDPVVAERDTRSGLELLQARLPEPAFAFLFASFGRGPDFHAGKNRDLELYKHYYPHTPLIGSYGLGEIGPLENETYLFQYTSVFSAFV